jgi:hypothetical protein
LYGKIPAKNLVAVQKVGESSASQAQLLSPWDIPVDFPIIDGLPGSQVL